MFSYSRLHVIFSCVLCINCATCMHTVYFMVIFDDVMRNPWEHCQVNDRVFPDPFSVFRRDWLMRLILMTVKLAN